MSKLGDVLMDLAVLVWVSVSVGPWWVGVAIFVGAWVFNIIGAAVTGTLSRRQPHGDSK